MNLPEKDQVIQSMDDNYYFFDKFINKKDPEFRKYLNSFYRKYKYFNTNDINELSYLFDIIDEYKNKFKTCEDLIVINKICDYTILSKMYAYCNDFLKGCFVCSVKNKTNIFNHLKIECTVSKGDLLYLSSPAEYIVTLDTSNANCFLLCFTRLSVHKNIDDKKLDKVSIYVLGNPFKITNGQIQSFLNKLYTNISEYSIDVENHNKRNVEDLLGSIDWSNNCEDINKTISDSSFAKWFIEYSKKDTLIELLEDKVIQKNSLYKDMGCKYYLALDAESIEDKKAIPRVCRIYIPTKE